MRDRRADGDEFAAIRKERDELAARLEKAVSFAHERESVSVQSTPSPPRSAETITAESGADSTLHRVGLLKRYFAEHPDKAIPELRYLTDQDWLNVADSAPLASEAQVRNALDQLRQLAKQFFIQNVQLALGAYAAAHNGEWPLDPAALAPFLSDHADADILARYERLDGSLLFLTPPMPNQNWLYQEKPSQVADDWVDTVFYFGKEGVGMTRRGILGPVTEAVTLFEKNAGRKPRNAHDIIPYLKSPLALEKINEILAGL